MEVKEEGRAELLRLGTLYNKADCRANRMLDVRKYLKLARLIPIIKDFLLLPGESTTTNKFYLKGLLE